MVHGVSRPRSQLVIKIIVAATLTALCMFILRQYDSAGTVDMVYFLYWVDAHFCLEIGVLKRYLEPWVSWDGIDSQSFEQSAVE